MSNHYQSINQTVYTVQLYPIFMGCASTCILASSFIIILFETRMNLDKNMNVAKVAVLSTHNFPRYWLHVHTFCQSVLGCQCLVSIFCYTWVQVCCPISDHVWSDNSLHVSLLHFTMERTHIKATVVASVRRGWQMPCLARALKCHSLKGICTWQQTPQSKEIYRQWFLLWLD